MDSYDAWKTSPPEPKQIGSCAHCGDSINEGDPYYIIDGGPDIVEKDCFLEYAEGELNVEKVNMF